jgi:S1-C subfamily serine protease
MIYNPNCHCIGTAFFINAHYLITANHVVANSTKIYAIRGDHVYPLKLVYANSTYDFAILYLNVSIQYYAFPLAEPQIGQSVQVLGYPGINYFILDLAQFSPTLALEVYSEQPSFSQGYIGNIFNETLIQFTAPVDEGTSGGPLISGGSVVGYVDFALPPGHLEALQHIFTAFR